MVGLAFRYQQSIAKLSRVAHDDSRRQLWSLDMAALAIARSKHSMIGDRMFPIAAAWSETIYDLLPFHLHHCQNSSGDWRQSFSHAHTLPLNTKQA